MLPRANRDVVPAEEDDGHRTSTAATRTLFFKAALMPKINISAPEPSSLIKSTMMSATVVRDPKS